MNMFKSILKFVTGNPSICWTENNQVPIELNLDQHTFCNIKLNDEVQKLSFLGPGKYKSGELSYPQKGFLIDSKDNLIKHFAITPDFSGEIIYQGKPIRFKDLSTTTHIKKALGDPFWEFQGEFDTSLYYEFPNVEWNFCSTVSGVTEELDIGTPPVLSHADQRKIVKCTKPWPPKFED